jgi:hypothetical protein
LRSAQRTTSAACPTSAPLVCGTDTHGYAVRHNGIGHVSI